MYEGLPRGYIPIMTESEFETEFMTFEFSKKALLNDMQGEINGFIRRRLDEKSNISFTWWGPSGSGKSFSALDVWEKRIGIKKEISRDFKRQLGKYIIFRNDQLEEALIRAHNGDTFMKDENPYEHGIGSKAEKERIETIAAIVRRKRINLLFLHPRFVRHINSHYFFKMIMQDNAKRLRMVGVYSEVQSFLGRYETGYPSEQLVREYLKLKDEFLDNELQQTGSNRYKRFEHIAGTIMSSDSYNEKLNSSEIRTLVMIKYPRLAGTEARMIADMVRMEQKKRKLDAK